MHSPSFNQLRDCRSCSPPDGSASGRTQAANRCCPLRQPENSSTVPEEETKTDIGSSLERLSFGSQDEVFLSPVNNNQQGKQVVVKSAKDGPDTAATPKESARTRNVVISGAHGCSSYRTDAADGGQSLTGARGETERGSGGGLFTGSAQLTLKQDKKESSVFEVPAKGAVPHRLIRLSSRTTSSGDNDDNNDDNRATTTTTVATMIQAQSKAVSYESICLKVKDEFPPEVPKTIHILTSGQSSSHRAHCFRPALPEAKEEEEKEGETSSLHPKYQGKEAANHLSVIASFSLERPLETKTVLQDRLQSEIASPVQRQTRTRQPHLDSEPRSNGKELPRSAQRELILELNVLPGSAPGAKDNARSLRQNEASAPKDGAKQTAVNVTLDNGVVKRMAKVETPEGNFSKRSSELELARSRLANVVVETPSMKVSKRKHLFEKQSNPAVNKFMMGTVFIDRNKAQPETSLGKTESLPSENSRRIEEKKPTTTGRSQQPPLTCTLHLVQATVQSANDGGNAIKEETTTAAATTTATTTTGSQEHAARAATLPKLTSAGISEAEQQQQQHSATVSKGRASTQFLSTVSRFSQPSTTTASIIIGRLNPISRVSWAKQRFGDGPPSANVKPTSANNRQDVVIVTSPQTFPGPSSLDRAKQRADVTKREDLLASNLDRLADRCALLKKSNASIALEYSGKKKQNSTSESTVASVVGAESSAPISTRVILVTVSSKNDQVSSQAACIGSEKALVPRQTEATAAEINRSKDTGGVVGETVHSSTKDDRLQDKRSIGVCVSIEKSGRGTSNVDGKIDGSGTLNRVEKPDTLSCVPRVRAGNDVTISRLNRSSDRFELSPIDVSGSPDDVICPAVTSPRPCVDDVRPQPDIEQLDSTCTDTNGYSIKSEPTAHMGVVVYAEIVAPPVANITLKPILGESVEEVKESREGAANSEQGQGAVQKKATDSDKSSLLELEATISKQLESLNDVDFQGNVSKRSILSETPKQDLLSSEHDNKEEHKEQEQEQEPERQEQEEDASSLVELSEEKLDEEASGESSHCSMEVICEDEMPNSEVDPLVKKPGVPPSNPHLNKGSESMASSSDRSTTVRLGDDDQQPTPVPNDGDAAASLSLEHPTSPVEKKGSAKTTCIVRKQLIHLDGALHPASCVPPESKPVSSKWSPKLVRKLNLADAQDVDVSDLSVDPKLMDFLSRQIDRAAAEKPDPTADAPQGDKFAGKLSKLDRGEKAPSFRPAAPAETEKPDGEAEKRKFFSALKANAASFRAKLSAGGDESRSQERLHPLDRLTSFAIISDVGIGAKRRQFQNATDPHARLTTSGSSAVEKRETGSVAPSSRDDVTASLLPASVKTPDESKTRLRKQKADDDDDDDFDRLVEINFRQLVEERAAGKDQSARTAPSKARTKVKASSSFNRSISTDRTTSDRTKSSAAAAAAGGGGDDDDCLSLNAKSTNDSSRSSLDEKCKLLREKLKEGSESALKFHGSRRQMPRFKTQPVTFDEVEKAFEKALHHDDS